MFHSNGKFIITVKGMKMPYILTLMVNNFFLRITSNVSMTRYRGPYGHI